MNVIPVIFLRGGPAVGKSSTARVLAELLPRSAIVEQDALRYMVRGGLVACGAGLHPSADPDGYRRQCAIGDENALAVARNLARHGFVPIIAGFDGGESSHSFLPGAELTRASWTPSRARIEEALPGLAAHQIVLDAPPSVLEARLAARGHDARAIRFVLAQRERFLAGVPSELTPFKVDTAVLDPRAVAAIILERAGLGGGAAW